jgi:hypothetical protein
MTRRSKARFAATLVLSYILSLSLLALITGVILLRCVLNPWYIAGQIERSGFSEQAAAELREIYISYGLASGVSREAMEPLITASHISSAAESSIMESFGLSGEFDFAGYIDKTNLALHSYVASQSVYITPDVELGIQSIAELCADTLSDYLDSPIFGVPARMQRYTPYLFLVMAASAAISIAAAIVIPAINKRVTRWIDGYIYALSATALMCVALPIIAQGSGLTSRLQITPISYNKFILSWLEGIFNGYLIALIPIVSLIVICVAVRLIRWKRRAEISRAPFNNA